MKDINFKKYKKNFQILSAISMLVYNILFNALEIDYYKFFFSTLLVVVIPLVCNLYILYQYSKLGMKSKIELSKILLLIILILIYAYFSLGYLL